MDIKQATFRAMEALGYENPVAIEDSSTVVAASGLKTLLRVRDALLKVAQDSQERHPYKINENYLIRSVTFHYTGRLTSVYNHEIVLEDAAWIADDGRFKDAVEKGTFNEIEPYPAGEVIIGRGAITDAKVVTFPLPKHQK